MRLAVILCLLGMTGPLRADVRCAFPFNALFREPVEFANLGASWVSHDPQSPAISDGSHVALGVRPESPLYTHALMGTAQWKEVAPDYRVLVIKDAEGRTHHVDPKYLRSVRVWGEEGEPPKRELRPSHERDLMALDHERLKSALCAQRRARQKDPRYAELQKQVEANYRNSRAMRRFLVARCGVSLAAFLPLRTAFRAYRMGRREAGDRDVVTEHGSNFVTGLLYMSMVHGCLSSLTGDERRIFLTLTLGANVVGNVWEEIDIPGVPQKSLPMFTSAGNEVKTDLGDFAAGLLSTATYAAGALAMEKALGFGLAQLCL